ncbi:MAG: hypothetical protein Q9216_003815 [Gyalolechia sp. 2 TL-2023]
MDELYSDTPTDSREAAMQASLRARISATARDRVTQLVLDYGAIHTMHPAVAILRRSQASDIMFQQAMTNDYKLLCNRSPHLEDYEINIYEAAFSKLMADVDTHIGAIHIYVEEILGLRAVSQPLKLRALTNAVKVRTMISNFAVNENRTQPSPMLNNPPAQYPYAFTQTRSGMQLLNNLAARSNTFSAQQLFSNEPHGDNDHGLAVPSSNIQSRSLFNHPEQPIYQSTPMDLSPHDFQTKSFASLSSSSSTSSNNNPTLNDLLPAYHDAIANFRMTAADTTVQLNFARVLRDRAEQCFNCMREVNPGDIRLNDFYESYAEARRAVEAGEQATTQDPFPMCSG